MSRKDQTPAFTGEAMSEEERAAWLEAGRLLFAREATFMLGVAGLAQLPDTDLPEVCFAGRSNVGKSSLINALTGRNTLARTSVTPGRTQELNFFNLADRLILADLPGYGFAQAPKDKVQAWTRLTMAYLRGRPQLRRVLVLVDSRHGLKDVDHDVMKMLDQAAVNYQVVLTKIDKLKKGEAEQRLTQVQGELARHVAAHPEVILTSSEKGIGIPELRATLAALGLPL
ncbi:ribosome biogenesis GTP-binding protein YihA/YsxC [Caenispirillum bisanense]|uniref:ribosome biogenesis GTP-binding protein YihA/YsxC n=1 Tax=Caenispirillum bisanense TaxID=414052 RepID=UPI0031E2D0FC